jgi:hypothetical protein
MIATALARNIAKRISNKEVDYVCTLMANQDRADLSSSSLADYLISKGWDLGSRW